MTPSGESSPRIGQRLHAHRTGPAGQSERRDGINATTTSTTPSPIATSATRSRGRSRDQLADRKKAPMTIRTGRRPAAARRVDRSPRGATGDVPVAGSQRSTGSRPRRRPALARGDADRALRDDDRHHDVDEQGEPAGQDDQHRPHDPDDRRIESSISATPPATPAASGRRAIDRADQSQPSSGSRRTSRRSLGRSRSLGACRSRASSRSSRPGRGRGRRSRSSRRCSPRYAASARRPRRRTSGPRRRWPGSSRSSTRAGGSPRASRR